jgi:VCBS repeat-containing protein
MRRTNWKNWLKPTRTRAPKRRIGGLLENLERRQMLDGTSFDVRLSVYVDSEFVSIPTGIGVDAQGNKLSQVHTLDDDGTLSIAPIGSEALEDVTLGDFFATWRTNGGTAGNNSAATFDDDELMGEVTDATNTIQMFVNGQVVTEYDEYVLEDGDEIVLVYGHNPVIAINTNYGAIVIELYEDETPGTVENFLNYVNDGDYINSIFHRVDKDFVIQGGGFKTSSTTFTNTSQFSAIDTDDPIENEPGISNLRGTIAMAKLGGDPDSATSQFFVNLSDNNKFLDTEANNAFTVFGKVLDMTTVDRIEDLPINDDNASPYGELPVGDNNQLVVMQSIEGNGEIAGVRFIDTDGDGVRDTGEAGVAGAVMYLDLDRDGVLDDNEPTTSTDANGAYRFQVEPGEYLVRAQLPAGTHLTSEDAEDGFTVTVEIGVTHDGFNFGQVTLAAPSAVALAAASDTGTSNSDRVTKLNNASTAAALQFIVSGVTDGATVTIFVDGVAIGSALADDGQATITTNGTSSLSNGNHTITAVQTVQGIDSEASASISITVDAAPPAAISNTAPALATINELYSFDAASDDEGESGMVYSLVDAPTGMTIDAATGQIAWTPTAAQAVPQRFVIRLADAAGNEVTQTVDLTVYGEIPADADAYTVDEDGTLTVDDEEGVLANDGDEETGDLTAELVDGPEHGDITFNADGSFTYTPDPNFFGTDEFTYRASDGDTETNVARVTITVNAQDDAFVPEEDEYDIDEDGTLTVDADEGVLSNDENPDDDELTASLVTSTTNGTLTFNADGSFTYKPNAGYVGTDSFTYQVTNGTTTSDPVTVSLTVDAVNDAPTGTADSYTVEEDGTLTVNAADGVLKNDSDAEDDDLTVSVVDQPTKGTLTLNADGSFTYKPNAGYSGTDTFTYKISDGEDESGEITVTITVEADPVETNPHDAFITKTYQIFLGRAAEDAGRDFYRALLNSGVMDEFAMAYAVQHSPEFATIQIKAMYQSYLGREADSSGLSAHLSYLQSGGSMDQLRAIILGSDEYLEEAGGDTDDFLQALYVDVLNRSIDSTGTATWTSAMRNGETRETVALRVMHSDEGARKLIETAYDDYFDRDAAESEITYHLNTLQQSQREETLSALFAASPEFQE